LEIGDNAMTNETVYKIKLTPIGNNSLYSRPVWAQSVNRFHYGGSGKTWTNKKLVEKSFGKLKNDREYGISFTCKIITFLLIEQNF